MAKIIVVAHTKGGVGKSTSAITIAIGLSLAGYKVWLVDGDRQQTSIAAITLRSESGKPSIAASAYQDGPTLRAQVMQQADNYDFVVIDVGGRDSTALRAAMTLANFLLIPFRPRKFDIWGMDDLQQVLDEARSIRGEVPTYAFVNAADFQGNDNADAAEYVASLPNVEMLPVSLGDRKAFSNATGSGLHISEYKPRDAKACEEAEQLQSAILKLI